jgi:NADPH:quinone reductase-like Zn-dependent oxidoreductase
MPSHLLLLPWSGTWRSHLLATESSFDRVPNDIPVEYAATLRVNPATAYLLLNQFVKLKAGDVIVQNAANSVCGQAVIQLARLAGVKTVNIIRDRYTGNTNFALLWVCGHFMWYSFEVLMCTHILVCP